MPSSPRASASIVVSGIVAILGGVIGTFFSLVPLLLFSTGLGVSVPFPATMRPILYATWLITLLCALFFVVTGIQVIRLRNWARISLLIISGCMLFFGAVGVVVIFVTIFVKPYSDPSVPKALLASVLAVTYGIPIVISLWWLILFTRRSVVAQFHAREQFSMAEFSQSGAQLPRQVSPAARAFRRFNNPDCPLGIRIIGWYLASFILMVPFLAFFSSRVPALYFGHAFRGPAAIAVYVLNFALLCIPGIGLLLLKRWSYPLTILTQLLGCANGIVSFASNSFETVMRATMASMQLPGPQPGMETMLHIVRYSMLLGMVIPIAILVTLFALRGKFYSAADRAASTPTNPVT